MCASPWSAASAQDEGPSWDLAQALDFEVGLGAGGYADAGQSTLAQGVLPNGAMGGAFVLDLGASYRLGQHGVGLRASLSFYDANEAAYSSYASVGHFSFMIAPTYRFRPFSTWIARPFHLDTFVDMGIGYWEHQSSVASLDGYPISSARLSGLAIPLRVGADVAVWDRLRVGASFQVALVIPTGNSLGARDADPAVWLGFTVDVRYTLPFEELSASSAGVALEVGLESRRVRTGERAPPRVTTTPEYARAVPTVRTVALLPPEPCESTPGCLAGLEALERALAAAGYRVIPWRSIVEGRRATGSATGTAASLGADVLFQVHRLSIERAAESGRWSRTLTGADELGAEDRAQLEELARAAEAEEGGAHRVSLDVEAILVAARARAWRYEAARESESDGRLRATFRRASASAPQSERYVMPPAHCQPDACSQPSAALACNPSLCGQWFRWSTVDASAGHRDGSADTALLDAMARAMAATFRSGGDAPVEELRASTEAQADGPAFGLGPEPLVAPPPLPEGSE